MKKTFSKTKFWQISTVIGLLLIAFVHCFKTTHDLLWAYDVDFDRDMAFIQGTLDGNFGKDPNFLNEYLWYNPLLFLIETCIVKTFHLPINIVLARAGTFLNLLGPIAFIFMMSRFFKFNVVLASLVSFLFLASGNLLAWGSATYSPWLYPGCFMQFIFYLNIYFCYQAFSTQKNFWFLILGIFSGISFLGHTAPTLLIILILISIQSGRIIDSIKNKQWKLLKKFFIQGIVTFIPFVIFSFPLLYFVAGKYNLQIVNRMAFEYFDYLFIPINFFKLLKENLSVSLLVAIIGFLGFYKNYQNVLVRKILFNWLIISTVLYLYTSLVPVVESKYNLLLPGVVPSFHFFFYLKALQSVFFGYGFYIITKPLLNIFSEQINRKRMTVMPESSIDYLFLATVLLIVILYLPVYSVRRDFVYGREESIKKANDKNKLKVYDWILKNIQQDEVILCEIETSIFPVMATSRKMVSINATFSNPYLDFKKKEVDRNSMLSFLKTGQPSTVLKLFDDYNVSAVLLTNSEIKNRKMILNIFSRIVFQNDEYTIFKKL